MFKLIATVAVVLAILACVRSTPSPAGDLRIQLGHRETRLEALRATDRALPFCTEGQVFEARNDVAVLRVCVSDTDGPVPAHLSFHPDGMHRLDPAATWHSGLLEPGTVRIERRPDGRRVVRAEGTTRLPVRAAVPSFLDTLEPAEVRIVGRLPL